MEGQERTRLVVLPPPPAETGFLCMASFGFTRKTFGNARWGALSGLWVDWCVCSQGVAHGLVCGWAVGPLRIWELGFLESVAFHFHVVDAHQVTL